MRWLMGFGEDAPMSGFEVEKRLRTSLVVRVRRKISEAWLESTSITDAAKLTLPRGRRNLRFMQICNQSDVHISFAASVLRRLTDLHDHHENLNITIDTAWFARPVFGTGGIDLLITYGNGHWPGMRVELLLPEKLTPMCSPELAGSPGDSARIASLANCVLLHSSPRQSDWMLWLQAEGAYQITGARNQIFDTQDFAMTAAASGYGVTMGDLHLARQDLESGALVTPFPRIIESGYGYYAICPVRADARAGVSDLIDWLVGERPK